MSVKPIIPIMSHSHSAFVLSILFIILSKPAIVYISRSNIVLSKPDNRCELVERRLLINMHVTSIQSVD